jgi:hypothetical protein
MRYYLYIDNFRGFSNTYIPITDVNFLVGENSTGKTSVLSLLKLFSGGRFLIARQFGDEHVNFGHFSDIVSAHAEDKSYFTVGIISEESNGDKPSVAIGSLITYTPDEGVPRIAAFTFCRGTEKVVISFHGQTAYYKRERYEVPPTIEEITSVISQWKKEHRHTDNGFSKVELPTGFPQGRIPVLFLLSLVWQGSKGGSKNEKDSEVLSILDTPLTTPPELIWLAPIRTKPRRTYDELTLDFSPEGAHTPYLIRRMLRSRAKKSKFRNFMDKVGQASGLFQGVQIKNFGREATAPFEVDIILDGKPLNLSTVGYGVSQALPVLVELLTRSHATWFAIQQPEVHLHPRAQAALGDLFFELAANEHKRFLIETHSDFTIDRFRMNYARDGADKPDSQILFFERKENHNTVTSLKIGETGDLPTVQPDSYRAFFIREQMELLGI